jgi:hypothetical protein
VDRHLLISFSPSEFREGKGYFKIGYDTFLPCILQFIVHNRLIIHLSHSMTSSAVPAVRKVSINF